MKNLASFIVLLLFSYLTLLSSGSKWETINSEDMHSLWDIQFIGNQGWAAGYSGALTGLPSTILYTSDYGSNWTAQSPGTKEMLYSVFFINTKTGWSVGQGNTIIHTTDGGENWIIDRTGGENINFRSVFFTDINNGWIAGYDNDKPGAMVLHTTDAGKNWAQVLLTNKSLCLYKVFFLDSLNGWIAGNLPANIFHTTDGGKTWSDTELNMGDNIYSLHFISPNEGWACGGKYERAQYSSSMIVHTTDGGGSWEIQSSGNPYYLNDIYFINKDVGYSVGEAPSLGCGFVSGTVLKTTNGGKDWLGEPIFTALFHKAVFADSSQNVWVAGMDNWSTGYVLRFLNTREVNSVSGESSTDNGFIIIYDRTSDCIEIRPKEGTIAIEADIQIYNSLGGRVPVAIASGNGQAASKRIDVSDFPRGLYFLKINDSVQKFVITRM